MSSGRRWFCEGGDGRQVEFKKETESMEDMWEEVAREEIVLGKDEPVVFGRPLQWPGERHVGWFGGKRVIFALPGGGIATQRGDRCPHDRRPICLYRSAVIDRWDMSGERTEKSGRQRGVACYLYDNFSRAEMPGPKTLTSADARGKV